MDIYQYTQSQAGMPWTAPPAVQRPPELTLLATALIILAAGRIISDILWIWPWWTRSGSITIYTSAWVFYGLSIIVALLTVIFSIGLYTRSRWAQVGTLVIIPVQILLLLLRLIIAFVNQISHHMTAEEGIIYFFVVILNIALMLLCYGMFCYVLMQSRVQWYYAPRGDDGKLSGSLVFKALQSIMGFVLPYDANPVYALIACLLMLLGSGLLYAAMDAVSFITRFLREGVNLFDISVMTLPRFFLIDMVAFLLVFLGTFVIVAGFILLRSMERGKVWGVLAAILLLICPFVEVARMYFIFGSLEGLSSIIIRVLINALFDLVLPIVLLIYLLDPRMSRPPAPPVASYPQYPT